jgi:hypothetical protein
MFLQEDIEINANVHIIARERGKIVDTRDVHNIFTTIGREYVVDLFGGSSSETVQYISVGIGSDEQTVDISSVYPSLDSTYPGQNVFDDDDPSVSTLERPVQTTAIGRWMEAGSASEPVSTTYRIIYLFGQNDINLSGAYPIVPISETGLHLSSESPTANPYTGGSAPDYIGPARLTSQRVCAYNGFAPISKGPGVTLEVRWELRL